MNLTKVKLKNILVIYAALIGVVPLLVISFLVLMVASSNIEKTLHDKNLQIAKLYGNNISKYLIDPLQNLRELEVNHSKKRLSDNYLNDFINDLVVFHNYFDEIQILDLTGRIRYCNTKDADNIGMDMSNADYFKNALANPGVSWSSVFISISRNKPTLACSFRSEGYVYAGFLNLKNLNNDIKKINISPNSTIAVVDKNGLFIAHSDTVKVMQREYEPNFKKFLSKVNTAELIKEEYDNTIMHLSIVPVPVTNWYVIIYQPVTEIFASVDKLKQVFYLGIFLSVLISVTLVILIGKLVFRPLEILTEKTKEIANGDYNTSENIAGYYEVNQLYDNFIVMVKSIEEREQTIKDNEAKLIETQKIGRIGYWEIEPVTLEIKWSEQIYKLFEITPYSIKPSLDYLKSRISSKEYELLINENSHNLKHGIPFTFNFSLQSQSGSNIYISSIINYKKNIQGDVELIYGTMQDVTELKEITNALQESEEKLRRAFDAANEGLWELTAPSGKIYFSPRFYLMLRLTGITAISNINDFYEYVFDEDREKVHDSFNSLLSLKKKEIDIEFRMLNYNEEILWMHCKGKQISELNKIAERKFIGTFNDITSRKHYEAEVIKSEKKFRTLVQSIDDIVYTLSTDQKITSVYGQSLLRNGISPLKLLGKSPMEIYSQDTAEVHINANQKALKGEFVVFEWSSDNDGKMEYFLTSLSPIFGKNEKEIIGLVGISKDITFKKEIESELEERVKERTRQLEEANKELESFSYSVSHDLRTPIRAIEGLSKIIMADYGEKFEPEEEKLFKEVIDNADKMGKLIDNLLAFSRLGRKEVSKSVINMNELFNSVISDFKKIYTNANLNIKVGNLPTAFGDYSLIKQVAINLVSNAIKYSTGKVIQNISITGQLEKEHTVFCITDNGVGFNMKYADKLFGVFQRLHGVHEFEGTGVGLAIVHRIIHKHGGKVWADSKLNEGSSFFFSLPVVY